MPIRIRTCIVFLDRVQNLHIHAVRAPYSDEFFESIFGLRADVQIGRISSDLNIFLSESSIEYRTGVYPVNWLLICSAAVLCGCI